MTRLVRFLPAITLLAVLTVTASSEYTLARTVLALPWFVAWGVPVAIDSYVVAAVHTGRDVAPAMFVMALSLFAAAGSHAVARTDGRVPPEIAGPVGVVILSVLVLVAWRVHVLIARLTEPPAATARTNTGGARARSGGGTPRRPGRLPALTDAEALEIGTRVVRDARPANRDEYVAAFRAVRPGESTVIKRSYVPAKEAAARPELVAVG